LALALHAAGLEDVDVLEAASSVDELGVGINVLPHAVRELTELGLADELGAAGVATSEFVMYNKHGQRIWGEPRGLAAGYRWPQYSIHRGRLLGLLHRAFVERLGADHLQTGCRVIGCSQDGVSVSVHLADGTSVGGDVLVGADGIHSAIRAQFYPDEGPPLWNGITMWRAVTRSRPFLSGTSMAIVGHSGKRAVIYPIIAVGHDGEALTNIVLEAKTADGRPMPRQDWSHAVDSQEVRTMFGSMRFDWIDIRELIDAANQWWQYPMVDRDPLPRWSHGRVTLLGDAAHPMYPVGANGASQAILDARSLARSLALEATVEAALDAYDLARRPATAAVVVANRRAGPERCMDLAEERAPDGFARIDDVFAPGELEELSIQYKRTAGFDPVALNERPSWSIDESTTTPDERLGGQSQ
jgi:2-polyprenyl-6-methoxyphenol hydroxylase-like FAD-dependent oxidoreductase